MSATEMTPPVAVIDESLGGAGGDGDYINDSLRSSSPANLTSMLDDLSLLQQSQVDLVDDTLNTSTMQTYGLEDLSCSMIHCNGDGDFDVEGAVKNFCEEIQKKNQLIATLYNAVKKLMKQREEGEKVLASVENQVRYVHKVLKSRVENQNKESNAPKSTSHITAESGEEVVNHSNAVVLTCSNNINEVIVDGHKTNDIQNLNHEEVSTPSQNALNPSINIQCPSSEEKKLDKEASQVESKPENSSCLSPISQSLANSSQVFMPVNPESMRLTYSPTICEYEAEARSSPRDHICHQSVIEDLKLQLVDRDRKLEAAKKYLSEMTVEREGERDEFQHTIEDLILRCEELKKEKERSDQIVLQQKAELEDMMENLVATNRLKDEIIRRSQSSENELKMAVDKICELREIIRNLEDQVEDAAKQAVLYSEMKKGFCEDLRDAEEEIKRCNESMRYPEEDVSSVIEYTDELHGQVMELSRRVEEKLVELENFPWQGRPESSCSVKSGDDVSVRANAKLHNTSISSDGGVQDFFSRLSQGFRRLECNFDGLVRFEEVLMKKFSDAELKYKNEHRKFENLSLENKRLQKELDECRGKMIDFEKFINESACSFSSRQHETLRNVGHSVLHRVGDSSPAIKRHRSEDASLNPEHDDESDMEDVDYVDVEEHGSTPQPTTRTIPNSNQSLTTQGIREASTSISVVPQETSKAGSLSASYAATNVVPSVNITRVSTTYSIVNNIDMKTASSALQNKSRSVTDADELNYDEAEGSENIQPTFSSSKDNVSMQRLESEESTKTIAPSSSSKAGDIYMPSNRSSSTRSQPLQPDDEDVNDEDCEDDDLMSQGPHQRSPNAENSSLSMNPEAINSECMQDAGSRVSNNVSETSQNNRSRSRSSNTQDISARSRVESNLSECSQYSSSGNRLENTRISTSESKPGGPRKSQLPPNRGLILATDVHLVDNRLQGGRRIPSDDPNVDIYEISTVSDFEVEGGDVRYLGSHIIPAADLSLDPQSARDSRIDSVSDKVELEKIKTRLNMAQEALEEEKKKSDQLKRQLNQIAPYNGSKDGSTNLQNVRELEQALEQQERTETLLRRNIECAMTAIANLQAENEGLRETIRDLKNDLQRMQP